MTATDIDLDALIDALAARAAARARPLTNAAGDDITALAAAGLVTVNPGDLITSQWGNLTYGQSNLTFASVADRNSQWAAPPEGAQCVTLDTNSPWIYRAGAWHGRPVGLLGQIVGPTVAVSCGSTLTTIVSLSAPVVAGRWYGVRAFFLGAQQTSTATAVRAAVAPSPLTTNYFGASNSLAAGAFFYPSVAYQWQAATTGPQVFTIQASSTPGTLSVGVNAALVAIEDIGS